MNLNEKSFGMVIVFLGVALLTCIGGIIGLTATDHPVPDVLQNLGVGVLGGLVGMLVRTPQQPPPYRDDAGYSAIEEMLLVLLVFVVLVLVLAGLVG